MARINSKNKKMIWVFVEYGIHFWLLIFICNVVIFYAFRFFIMASTDTPSNSIPAAVSPTIEASAQASPSAEVMPTAVVAVKTPYPTVTPTPIGPLVDINFSMPGIGSNGGNLTPLHQQRDVNIYIYKDDVDTGDKNVQPLSTVRTKAFYDSNPNSPTYTSFVISKVDLGEVATKVYSFQLTFKTQQALMQLIKDDKDAKDVGGKIFRGKKRVLEAIPVQNLISGDIYPVVESDNVMDINDYNMLVNCFSGKSGTSECQSRSMADLDDNGVVDGTDYNLMLLSYRRLLEAGYPVPTNGAPKGIVINPTAASIIGKVDDLINPSPKPTAVPTVVPTKKPEKPAVKSSGSAGGMLLMFVLLILVGGAVFAGFKLHLFDKFLAGRKGAKPQASPDQAAVVQQDGTTVAADAPADTQSGTSSPDAGGATVVNEDSAKQGDVQPPIVPPQPVIEEKPEQGMDNKQADDGTQIKQDSNTVFSKDEVKKDAAGVLERSGYLKKTKDDEGGKGIWVTLADDTGITRGLYLGKSVEDGFAKVKGTMKNDQDNKPYIEITEIKPEE